LRDQAQHFADLDCRIFGVSFDTVADNAAFKEKHEFPFPLLCDTGRSVGAAYEARQPDDHAFADYPKRVSYLIDPDGVIRRAYEVSDPGGHAAEVLADLRTLRGD
jgi:thioredoxin-dependent peroxiredoxin